MKTGNFACCTVFSLLATASPVLGQNLVDFTVSLDTASNPGAVMTDYYQAGLGTGDAWTIGFQVSVTEVNGNALSLYPLVAFCAELQEPIALQNYTFTSASLEEVSEGRAGEAGTASSAIPTGGIGDLRAARVRWLYDSYCQSEDLSSWTFTWSNPASIAFQLALWEITHDSDLDMTSTSGNVYLGAQSGGLEQNALSLASTWLAALDAAGVDETYQSQNYNIWTLVDTSGQGDTGDQDILFATEIGSAADMAISNAMAGVPEVRTVALAGLGLLLMSRLRSRR